MSFCGTPDAALAAELLQEYIKDTVERLERDLMMSPSASLRIDNISLMVADYLEKVGLQQQRNTFSFLRSEAAYYRNRREKSKTVILGQIADMYRGTEVSLQKVQDAYSQRAVWLPADTRRDVEAQLASLKLTQDNLKSVEDMANLFFDRYGDALHILALSKDEFVKVTKAVLDPTPLVSHMCAAEGYVSVLRASWVADDAALQRATAVFVQARRDSRYDIAAAELQKIKKDVDVTAQQTRAAIDGIKVISSGIKGPAVISSSSAYLSGRSVAVEDLLQARTRFNRILDCVNGCRKDAECLCATVQALMLAIEDAPITCGRSC